MNEPAKGQCAGRSIEPAKSPLQNAEAATIDAGLPARTGAAPVAAVVLPDYLESEVYVDSIMGHERSNPDCRCAICRLDIVGPEACRESCT